MHLRLVSRLLAGAVLGGFIAPLHAAETPEGPPQVKNAKESGWVFSILPKSMQANPPLDMTVITELTAEGKKRPVASAEKPQYYLSQCTGYLTLGHAPAGETKPPVEQLGAALTRSLASAGFLDAGSTNHPPELAILYNWGSHGTITDDPDDPTVSDEAKVNNLITRALLVGGRKFTHDLVKALEDATTMKQAQDSSASVPGGQAILSDDAFAFANPISVLRRSSATTEFLMEQSNTDIYFVVASAYDYAAMAKGHHILLWRTRMTVSAAGVNMTQSLPALIATAGQYFGKDMPEPAALVRRAKEGRVEIGTATVVEPSSKDAPPPAPPKK